MSQDKPIPFVDLHSLEEDSRIDLIGRAVMDSKQVVGVLVDDEPGKPERYIRKLRERFPGLLDARVAGPTPGVVTLRFWRGEG